MIVAAIRCKVFPPGSAAMAIVFLIDLIGFSTYVFFSKTATIIPDGGDVFNFLWSVVTRLHAALMIGHYVLAFSVDYAKQNGMRFIDLVTRLWEQ